MTGRDDHGQHPRIRTAPLEDTGAAQGNTKMGEEQAGAWAPLVWTEGRRD